MLKNVLASDLLVMGPHYQDLVSPWPGADRATFHVVGQPRFDHLLAASWQASRERLLQRFQNHAGSHAAALVTLAPQTQLRALVERQYWDSVAAVRELPGGVLIVSPHPAQPAGTYEPLIAAASSSASTPQVFLNTDRDTARDLWIASDAVVTYFSTVGLEAAVAGAPLVEQNYLGNKTLDLAPWNVSLNARHADELARILAIAVDSSSAFRRELPTSRWRFLQNVCIMPPEGAAERAAKALLRIAGKQAEAGGQIT